MTSVHNLFVKRTLHVQKSVPDDVVLCELGRVPLQLFWQKLTLEFVSRLTTLPSDRLVKRAFLQAAELWTPWWQHLSTFLSDHHLEGLLADGPFYVTNAAQSLRDQWYKSVCQSSGTKVSFFIDNMSSIVQTRHNIWVL